MKKLTWHEVLEAFTQLNDDIDEGKIDKTDKIAIAVITKDSFSKPYSEEERSYVFSSNCKRFHSNMIGNSIFANSLDGSDVGVRLDYYIPDSWKVDYCYILD